MICILLTMKSQKLFMKHPEWLFEQGSELLFPEIEWSRPVTKRGAGKLLIIGGQAQEFSNVATAYMSASQAGAGTIRVIMPSSTEKHTKMLPNIEYAPSNPSGSFSRASLASFLEASTWADHVMLAGDLGKNSETTTILDGYLLKCPRPVTITTNALSSIGMPRTQLLQRDITLILQTPVLQKIVTEFGLTTPLTSGSNRLQITGILNEITKGAKGSVIYQKSRDDAFVGHNGNVCASSTKHLNDNTIASFASVWRMQQPTKPFEALVSSLLAS